MKIFAACLLAFLAFSYGKPLRDPPPPSANNVTVNATWAFSSEAKITNVVMTVNNLKSSQYAAMGLSQNQSMVRMRILPGILVECFLSRANRMCLFVNDLPMIQLPYNDSSILEVINIRLLLDRNRVASLHRCLQHLSMVL